MRTVFPFAAIASACVMSLQVAGWIPAPSRESGEVGATVARASTSTTKHAGEDADKNQDPVLIENIATLRKGIEFLSSKPGYTATFHMQEVISGDLRDPQEIDLRIRNQPFAAYLKWRASKKEVLYPFQAGSDKMRVHYSGIKGLLGDVTIAPDASLAKTEGRHPVTDVGMLKLAELLLSYRERDLNNASGVTLTKAPDETIGDRPCDVFIAEYTDPKFEPTFRKAVYHIDQEHSIPLSFRGYAWGNGGETSDEATLLERYEYHDVKFVAFNDGDFDYRNEMYSFKR